MFLWVGNPILASTRGSNPASSRQAEPSEGCLILIFPWCFVDCKRSGCVDFYSQVKVRVRLPKAPLSRWTPPDQLWYGGPTKNGCGSKPCTPGDIQIGGTWVFSRPKMEAYVTTHGQMEPQVVRQLLFVEVCMVCLAEHGTQTPTMFKIAVSLRGPILC